MSIEMKKHSKIIKQIRWVIERGEKDFVIYPFGALGGIVADILNCQFGIRPAYVVDNTLSKINPSILSADKLADLDSEKYMVILAIENPDTIEIIRQSVYSYFPKERVVELFPRKISRDVRVSWLRRWAGFATQNKLEGSVAECGVFRGDFARYINLFFPNRKLYLFDSFEGFRQTDINVDDGVDPIKDTLDRNTWFGDIDKWKGTSVDLVMSKMSHPNNVVIKKGYIPETLTGIEDRFCFVNLDMDIYKPMLEAIRFFYPRMVEGGVMLLHDYYSESLLTGVEAAVSEYEKEIGAILCKIPAEYSSSLVIVKN